jgi:Zn-dependent oligopeptidase
MEFVELPSQVMETGVTEPKLWHYSQRITKPETNPDGIRK